MKYEKHLQKTIGSRFAVCALFISGLACFSFLRQVIANPYDLPPVFVPLAKLEPGAYFSFQMQTKTV